MNTAISQVLALAAVLGAAGAARAQCDILWTNGWTNFGFESVRWSQPPRDRETADDFDVTARVHRIVAGGNGCGGCQAPDIAGVHVRFYAPAGDRPGDLQREYFIEDGDPRLLYDPGEPETLDITLPEPFEAAGRHFVSVQVSFNGGGYWSWWGANRGDPDLSHLWRRDNLQGGVWTAPEDPFFGGAFAIDADFTLYGEDGENEPPPAGPCGEWFPVPSPSPTLDQNLLRGVAVIAPDDVWAVGDYNAGAGGGTPKLSLAMRWDGSGWTIFPTPCPDGSSVWCDLYDVDAVAGDDAWAVGSFRQHGSSAETYTLHWNGAQWDLVPSPVAPPGAQGSFFNAVDMIAPDDVWAVGAWSLPGTYQRLDTLAAHWDGSSWTAFTPPPLDFIQEQELRGVSAISSDDVWAVGGFGQTEYRPYVVRWDGSEWRLVDPQPDADVFGGLNDVLAFAPDDVWVTAVQIGGGPTVLHWDGDGWTAVPVPGPIAELAGAAPDDIWGAGGDTLLHWNGSAWTVADRFACIASPAVGDLDVSSGCDVWAAGRQVLVELQTLTVRLLGGSGVPCAADFDGDGSLDSNDFFAFLESYFAGAPGADFNGDTAVNSDDFFGFLNAFFQGC